MIVTYCMKGLYPSHDWKSLKLLSSTSISCINSSLHSPTTTIPTIPTIPTTTTTKRESKGDKISLPIAPMTTRRRSIEAKRFLDSLTFQKSLNLNWGRRNLEYSPSSSMTDTQKRSFSSSKKYLIQEYFSSHKISVRNPRIPKSKEGFSLSPNQLLDMAFNLQKEGNHEESLVHYQILLHYFEPNNTSALYNCGILQRILGQLIPSLKSFNRVLELDPYDVDAYFERANTLYLMKWLEEAVIDYCRAIDLCLLDYDNCVDIDRMSTAIMENENIESGISSSGISSGISSGSIDSSGSSGSSGSSIDSNGSRSICEGKYNTEKRKKPQRYDHVEPYAKILTARGSLYFEMKRFEESLSDFLTLADMFPSDYENHYTCGIIYEQMRRYKDALSSFNQSFLLNCNHFETIVHRGTVLHKLGLYQEALHDFDKAISMNPNSAVCFNNRGSSLFYLERYMESLKDFDRCLELQPENQAATTNRSALLEKISQISSDSTLSFNSLHPLTSTSSISSSSSSSSSLASVSLASQKTTAGETTITNSSPLFSSENTSHHDPYSPSIPDPQLQEIKL